MVLNLTFDFGDLKLRDLTKFWFFKLIMTKSNFKKISYDVISATFCYYVTENITKLTSQNPFWLLPIKISGYTPMCLQLLFYKDCTVRRQSI